MAIVLERKCTKKDSSNDIVAAIHKLASDKNTRVLLADCLEWEQTKLKEIKRLSKILLQRHLDTEEQKKSFIKEWEDAGRIAG